MRKNRIPILVTGDWNVTIGPGPIRDEGDSGRSSPTLSQATVLSVSPNKPIRVSDERFASLAIFNAQTPWGWTSGERLSRLIAQECSVTGLLLPESVRVKAAAGEGPTFIRGVDFEIDPQWATVGRLEGGVIGPDQPVYVDYAYAPRRLDSIVLVDDRVALIEGEPGAAIVVPPETPPGATLVGRVFLNGPMERLSEEALFPVRQEPKREAGASEQKAGSSATPVAASALLPRTLAKLRNGEPLTVVAWGDSVTAGGGVLTVRANSPLGDTPREDWYQYQFVEGLRRRFPKADIRLHSAAWPGASSAMYLDAAPGGEFDFARDVIERKPDLVTVEFVNDAYLDEAGVEEHYGKILGLLQGNGCEVVLITPHFVRPDWLPTQTLHVDADPRPYVKGLRAFAEERGIALADAAALWERLHGQGLPYITLLANDINHPDARGHRLYAKALLGLFPRE